MKYIRGFFRITHQKVTYYVTYERSQTPNGHGLRGGRIQALKVTDGARDVMLYEEGEWKQEPQTNDERGLLTLIIDRVR